MRHPIMLIGLGFFFLAQSVSWALNRNSLHWHHGLGVLCGVSAIAGGLYFWKQMGLPSFKAAIPLLIFLALIMGLLVWSDHRRFKEINFLQQKCTDAIFALINDSPVLNEERFEERRKEIEKICGERR